MSGFLTHLVARSTATADRLTPRPWSRFEPAAVPGHALDAPPDGDGPGEGAGEEPVAGPTRTGLPAAPGERAGEWPPRGPLPVEAGGPPVDATTAAAALPVLADALPRPAAAPPAGPGARSASEDRLAARHAPAAPRPPGTGRSPALPRPTGTPGTRPTMPGPVPAGPGGQERGAAHASGDPSGDAPGERAVPAGRRHEDRSRDAETTARAEAPGSTPSPRPGERTAEPIRAPGPRRSAAATDVGYRRPAVGSVADAPSRGAVPDAVIASTRAGTWGPPPAADRPDPERTGQPELRRPEDPARAAGTAGFAAPRAPDASGRAPHVPREAAPAVPVPAPGELRPPGTPARAAPPGVPHPVRVRPWPEEVPLLGQLRPQAGADAPVRAPGRRAPDPGPTIEVTIGRVEVRAAPPTPPARRRSAPRPAVVPLAEYLARRTGGR